MCILREVVVQVKWHYCRLQKAVNTNVCTLHVDVELHK